MTAGHNALRGSNRFATALEGVDIDNSGTALDRSRHPNPVPRVAGPSGAGIRCRCAMSSSCAATLRIESAILIDATCRPAGRAT
jgi:hypothetical protein